MKKLIIIVLVLLLVGGSAFGGYKLWEKFDGDDALTDTYLIRGYKWNEHVDEYIDSDTKDTYSESICYRNFDDKLFDIFSDLETGEVKAVVEVNGQKVTLTGYVIINDEDLPLNSRVL